jgi:hypothetical protein
MVVHGSFVYLFVQFDNMFDKKYVPSVRQPMTKQLDKLHREGIHGEPNFLTWFREHINPHLTSGLSMTYIMFNHLTY